MYTFHVVVWHQKQKTFSSLRYTTDNEVLTETDLLKIEDVHVDRSGGFRYVTTEIISWQMIKVEEGRRKVEQAARRVIERNRGGLSRLAEEN